MKYLTLILAALFFSHCSAPYQLIEENHPYGLYGQLLAKEGNADQLSKILLEAAKLMKKAQGCQMYMISTDNSNENSVIIYEVWDSKEHHDDSLQSPEVRELIGQAIPLLAAPPKQGQELKILGGLFR